VARDRGQRRAPPGNPKRHSRLDTVEHPDAILCRSNAGTIEQLLAAHGQGVQVHLVGGGREMRFLAEAACQMQAGQPAAHLELAAFSTWAEVVEYAEKDPAGSDLAVGVRMIERYGAGEVLGAIKGCVAQRRAKLTVSTAHKAKGLEWSRVRIADDFREPLDMRTGAALAIPAADAMLAYVAVTRAQDTLDTGGLKWVHTHLEALGGISVSLPAPVGVEDQAQSAAAALDAALCAAGTAVLAGHTMQSEANHEALMAFGAEHPENLDASQIAEPVELSTEDPAAHTTTGHCPPAITIGTRVLVADERGVFVVTGENADGSLTCYPRGAQGAGARSFRPEWCVPAERQGEDGTVSRVRAVPPSARQARALWRAQHGFPSFDHLDAPHGAELGSPVSVVAI